jgi:hypothetical protein
MKKCVYCHRRIRRSDSYGWMEKVSMGLAKSSPGATLSDLDWDNLLKTGEKMYGHSDCMRLRHLELQVSKLENGVMSEERIETFIKEKIDKEVTSKW